jgi:hypothetical protein
MGKIGIFLEVVVEISEAAGGNFFRAEDEAGEVVA